MKLGLGNTLLLSPVNSVPPLSERPTFGVSFDRSRYTNDAGFANQSSVGSSSFNLLAYNGPDPIFTRATAATFRGSDGLIQYAPENLLQYSEQFDATPYWTPNQVAVAPNQITSPSGLVNAYRLTTNGSAAVQRIGQNSTLVGVSTYSIYVKAGTASFVQILHGSNVNVYANFNVSTGTAGNVGSSAVSSITSIGDGWYRCVVSATIASTQNWYFYITNGNTATYGAAFPATVADLYIWGAQLERSSTARPYISTTALPVYGPRFEYALDGSPLGLLLEKQSQNLFQYSEVFKPTDSGNYWSTTTANAVTSDQTTAPSGLVTADLLTTSATSFDCFVRRTLNWVGSTQYSYSVFLKRGPSNYRYVGLYIGAGISSTQFPYFDFDNPSSVQIPSGTMVGTINSTRVDAYSNGWYRVSVSFTTAATPVTAFAGVYISTSNGTLPSTSTAGLNCYIWGIQAETGPFVTSYMPTSNSTPPRNADACSAAIGSWLNISEGTIVVSGDRNNNPSLNTTSNDSFYEFTGSTGYLVVHASDGVTEAIYDSSGSLATASGATVGSLTTVASSYSDITDLLHISRNGTATQSGAATGFGVAPVTLNIGYAPTSGIDYWNGHIKSFRYFPKAFPNKLQQYSSV